jgi:hypothetical protein
MPFMPFMVIIRLFTISSFLREPLNSQHETMTPDCAKQCDFGSYSASSAQVLIGICAWADKAVLFD